MQWKRVLNCSLHPIAATQESQSSLVKLARILIQEAASTPVVKRNDIGIEMRGKIIIQLCLNYAIWESLKSKQVLESNVVLIQGSMLTKGTAGGRKEGMGTSASASSVV
jgi:hypothetical protein